ncbi:MAG: phosphotransferase [Akkermansiaceae bacterium]|nr:phosphotransferase [Armatimonadota bacterium]
MDVTATDTNHASEIVAAFTGDVVRTASPIIGKGSVNKIVVCGTERGEPIVVRMSSAEDEGRGLSFYEKERWCIEEAAKRGVPGPTVLAIGRWGTRPYMIQTLVPGISGEESALGSQHVWHALGRHAKIVHSISLDGFGEMLDQFHCGDAQQKWHDFVHYNICSLTPDDELPRLQVYAPEQQDTIRRVFENLLTPSFRFGLNHGDLSPRNVLIDADATVHLLDWGSAEAHIVPHYDFLHIVPWDDLQNENFRAFLEGYEMSEAMFARILPELRSLLLLKSFDLTRWAIDRCPERTTSIAARAREALRLLLQ